MHIHYTGMLLDLGMNVDAEDFDGGYRGCTLYTVQYVDLGDGCRL